MHNFDPEELPFKMFFRSGRRNWHLLDACALSETMLGALQKILH